MTIRSFTPAVALSTLVLTLAAAQAQTSTSASSSAQPSAFQQWVNEVKAPAPWLTWGADIRVRDEYYNNSVTLTDSDPGNLNEQNVIRARGRLWTSLTPVTNLSLNARLSAEVREWTKPSFTTAFANQQGMEWRYGILDNLNVKWNNAFDQPLSMTVGRQDIAFGEYWNWWLVADGTPGDGSWTFFLDSARLTYEVKDIKTKFDLIYIHQDADPDAWLPTIDKPRYEGTDYQLTEQDEQGVIAYVSNKSIKDTTIDGYFIYKGDDQATFKRYGVDTTYGDNADIYTVGARFTGLYGNHWQPSLEGAYQFGTKEENIPATFVNAGFAERDLSAWGLNAKLTYLVKDRLNNQFSLIYEHLSGDDPDTADDEMFDILWGRWPRWSELYIYSYIYETGGKIAQMNNVQRLGASWSLNPMKGMTLSAMYNALYAPQEVPTRRIGPATGSFSYDGNFRGHYLQAILKHQFTKQISAHLWGEFVWEGDYYAQRDRMTFLRAEVMFTF